MKSFTSGCNSTPPPPALVRLIHPVCYHIKPSLSTILHFLKPPSASLYCHGVVYYTVAKITSHSGYPSECTLSITIVRQHSSPLLTHQRLLGLLLGYTDLQILFMNHLRLSCQNATAFLHCRSASGTVAACSW